MKNYSVGRLIDMASQILLADVAYGGIGPDTQMQPRINRSFLLAEKFIAEGQRRERVEYDEPRDPRM